MQPQVKIVGDPDSLLRVVSNMSPTPLSISANWLDLREQVACICPPVELDVRSHAIRDRRSAGDKPGDALGADRTQERCAETGQLQEGLNRSWSVRSSRR